jgi:DnaJ-class molecular chaperone
LPHPASPLLGDLIIVFDVEFPTTLTDDQRDKLKDLL